MKDFEVPGPKPINDPIAVIKQALALAESAQMEQKLVTNKAINKIASLQKQNMRLMFYLIFILFVLLGLVIKSAGYW